MVALITAILHIVDYGDVQIDYGDERRDAYSVVRSLDKLEIDYRDTQPDYGDVTEF